MTVHRVVETTCPPSTLEDDVPLVVPTEFQAAFDVTYPASQTLLQGNRQFVETSPGFNLVADVVWSLTRSPSRMIVEKLTDPVDSTGQSFTFEGDVSGTIVSGATLFVDVPPGTYSSRELEQSGWALASIACDDSDSTGDIATKTATFVVAPAETVICTFTNRAQGRIIVEKLTDPVDLTGQTFTFTGDVAGTIASGQNLALDVPAGTYTVTELDQSGWALAAIACDDTDSSGDLDTQTATFVVGVGETIACRFTNSPARFHYEAFYDHQVIFGTKVNPASLQLQRYGVLISGPRATSRILNICMIDTWGITLTGPPGSTAGVLLSPVNDFGEAAAEFTSTNYLVIPSLGAFFVRSPALAICNQGGPFYSLSDPIFAGWDVTKFKAKIKSVFHDALFDVYVAGCPQPFRILLSSDSTTRENPKDLTGDLGASAEGDFTC
jgi:hypothetical protein